MKYHPNEYQHLRRWLLSANINVLFNKIYPKIYDILDFKNYLDVVENPSEELIIPRTLPLKRHLLDFENGLYLVDAGD